MLQNKPTSSVRGGPRLIHVSGIMLFLFIPIVLFLFLRFPFGVLSSFGLAIAIMIGHRFVALPFFMRHRHSRCIWCGRTGRVREGITMESGIDLQACVEKCAGRTRQFLNFTYQWRLILRAGIFLPLGWYIATMLLGAFDVFHFPVEWNRFIFQFFIACTVVAISFLYSTGSQKDPFRFPFPIHNLFLLGIQNTLLVFRYVGLWWIIAGLLFLRSEFLRAGILPALRSAG